MRFWQRNQLMSNSMIERAQALLDAHLQAKPKKPKLFQLLYDDTTYPALVQGMHQNTKNVCVSADEGTGTLNRLVTPGLSMLNSSWSNMPLKVARKTSDSFLLQDQRLALLISIQPGPFQEYRQRKSDLAKASGLWARMLVCGPLSTIGYREILPNEEHNFDPEPYRARMKKLIKKSANR